MSPNSQFPVDLVTFTEEIPNGKLHFLCSVYKTIVFKNIAKLLRTNPLMHNILKWTDTL